MKICTVICRKNLSTSKLFTDGREYQATQADDAPGNAWEIKDDRGHARVVLPNVKPSAHLPARYVENELNDGWFELKEGSARHVPDQVTPGAVAVPAGEKLQVKDSAAEQAIYARGVALRNELRQHTGSERIFHHSLVKSFNYTEGVRAFFQKAGNGAYWLGNILATELAIKNAVIAEGLCVAMLDVKAGNTAKLTVSRDCNSSDEEPVVYTPVGVRYERTISFTDCPAGQWRFYLAHTEVGDKEVILAMLPSEY